MVLNAIERMESQASPRDPSSSAAVPPGGSRGPGSGVASSAVTLVNTATTPSETCCPCPRALVGDSQEIGFADQSVDNDRGGSGSSSGSTAAARPAASSTSGYGGDSPASLQVSEQAGGGAVDVDAESESGSKAESEAEVEAKAIESGESLSSQPSGVLSTRDGSAGPEKSTLDRPGGRSSPAGLPAADSASVSIGNAGKGEGGDGAAGKEVEAERGPNPGREFAGLPALVADNATAEPTTSSTVSGGSDRRKSDNGIAASSEACEVRACAGIGSTAAPAAADDDLKDKGSNTGNGGECVEKHGGADAQGGSAKSTPASAGGTREAEAVEAANQQGGGSGMPRKKRPDHGAGVRGVAGDRGEEEAARLPAVPPNAADSGARTTLGAAASQGAEIEATGPGTSTRNCPALHATKATAAAATAGKRDHNGSGRTTAGGSSRSGSGSNSGAALAEASPRSDPRARQTPYRLNPRATPFTYNPAGFLTTTITGGGRAAVPGLCASAAAHPKPGSAAAGTTERSGQSVVARAGTSNRTPARGGAAESAAPPAPPEVVGVSAAVAEVASGSGDAVGAGATTATTGRKPRQKKKKKSRKKKEDNGNDNGNGNSNSNGNGNGNGNGGHEKRGEGGERGGGGGGVVDSRRASVAANTGGVVEACSDGKSGGAGVCDSRPLMPAGVGVGVGVANERPSSLKDRAQRRGADAVAGVHRNTDPAAFVSGREGKVIGSAAADGATGMETAQPTNLPVSDKVLPIVFACCRERPLASD